MKKMKKMFDAIVSFFKSLFGENKCETNVVFETPDIDKVYGGFEFRKSVEDPETQIEKLKVANGGMSYSWKRGCSLSGWGLAPDEARALAILITRKSGETKFSGGKFDWISQSRRTRDFKNIEKGYNGWPKDAVKTAKDVAFCIMSRDGKKRTNWLCVTK